MKAALFIAMGLFFPFVLLGDCRLVFHLTFDGNIIGE